MYNFKCTSQHLKDLKMSTCHNETNILKIAIMTCGHFRNVFMSMPFNLFCLQTYFAHIIGHEQMNMKLNDFFHWSYKDISRMSKMLLGCMVH